MRGQERKLETKRKISQINEETQTNKGTKTEKELNDSCLISLELL